MQDTALTQEFVRLVRVGSVIDEKIFFINTSRCILMNGDSRSSRRGSAIAFVSHIFDKTILRRFEKLSNEAHPDDDVFFIYDATNASDEELRSVRRAVGDQLETFHVPDVVDIDYPNPWAPSGADKLVPGNLDLLYLYFLQSNPGYSYYWFIEYDVAYTGSWSGFFRTFADSDADLIGTTIQSYEDRPNWYWWSTFEPASSISKPEWLRGFFPIVRLSPELLTLLDEAYRTGWSGHAEAVLPTLAQYHGCEIEDIGGDGQYVKENNTNRYYTNTSEKSDLAPGTFVYRPVRPRPGFRSQMLWHPVKPDQRYVDFCVKYIINWVRAQLF